MIAHVVLRSAGKTYEYNHYFEGDDRGDYPWESVVFMYTEGNYRCDCNRSLFIATKGNEDFEEMDCGDEIELVSLTPVPYVGVFLPPDPMWGIMRRADERAEALAIERGIWVPRAARLT
jgi:hypothetical protein